MDKQIELLQWKEIADTDFTHAVLTTKYSWPVPYAIVSFHCQQAVEKFLKWFLVLNNIEPPKTHDLAELEKLCETLEPQFSSIIDKCSFLTRFAVRTRYPNEVAIEKQDMDKALEYTKSIRDFFHDLFPDHFEELKLDGMTK